MHPIVHAEDARFAGNIVPKESLWGVYFDWESDALYIRPIIGFAIWVEVDPVGFLVNKFYPIALSDDGAMEEDIQIVPDSDFLGVSKTETIVRADWDESIAVLLSERRALQEDRKGDDVLGQIGTEA